MQLTAKLTQMLALQSGTGKNGQWRKQDIIVETEGQYPKKICISIWGDKINDSQLQIGNELKIDFDIESREYNGKWYTNIIALKIEVASTGGQNTPAEPVNNNLDMRNFEVNDYHSLVENSLIEKALLDKFNNLSDEELDKISGGRTFGESGIYNKGEKKSGEKAFDEEGLEL